MRWEEPLAPPKPTHCCIPMCSLNVPQPSPSCPRERLRGVIQKIRPMWRINHREDPPGYWLNLLLQSQSPSLKRPLQRRERRYRKGKSGKLMLARMVLTLQNMELPEHTRHRRPKVVEMPSEVCASLITVYFWWLYSLKYYFLPSFMKIQYFLSFFFKLCS